MVRKRNLSLLVAALAVLALLVSSCASTVAGTPVAADPTHSTIPTTTRQPDTDLTVPELMRQIRHTKPCAILNSPSLKIFGPDKDVRPYTIDGCQILVGYADTKKDRFLLTLELGHLYSDWAGVADKVAGHPARRANLKGYDVDLGLPKVTDTCYFTVPYGSYTGYGVFLRVKKLHADPDRPDVVWPERCKVTEKFLATIIDEALALPQRDTKPTPPTILGQDPCAAAEEAAALVPGNWTMGASPEYEGGPYTCEITLYKPGAGEKYTMSLTIAYWFGEAPDSETSVNGATAKLIQIEGFKGAQIREHGSRGRGGSCTDQLIVNEKTPRITVRDAVGVVDVWLTNAYSNPVPPQAPSCETVNEISKLVLRNLGYM